MSSIDGPLLLCRLSRLSRLSVVCNQHSHGNQAMPVALVSFAGIYLSPGSVVKVLIFITN